MTVDAAQVERALAALASRVREAEAANARHEAAARGAVWVIAEVTAERDVLRERVDAQAAEIASARALIALDDRGEALADAVIAELRAEVVRLRAVISRTGQALGCEWSDGDRVPVAAEAQRARLRDGLAPIARHEAAAAVRIAVGPRVAVVCPLCGCSSGGGER